MIVLLSCAKTDSSDTIELNEKSFKYFELDTTCENNESLILLKDRKVDFGTIKEKETSKLLIYFPYANIGNSKLVILKTDVSCRCLSATYSKKPLERGEIGLMEVLVDIKNQKVFLIKRYSLSLMQLMMLKLFVLKGLWNNVDLEF